MIGGLAGEMPARGGDGSSIFSIEGLSKARGDRGGDTGGRGAGYFGAGGVLGICVR